MNNDNERNSDMENQRRQTCDKVETGEYLGVPKTICSKDKLRGSTHMYCDMVPEMSDTNVL